MFTLQNMDFFKILLKTPGVVFGIFSAGFPQVKWGYFLLDSPRWSEDISAGFPQVKWGYFLIWRFFTFLKTQEECSEIYGRFFFEPWSQMMVQKFMYNIFFYDDTCINKDIKNYLSRTVKSDHIDFFWVNIFFCKMMFFKNKLFVIFKMVS